MLQSEVGCGSDLTIKLSEGSSHYRDSLTIHLL